MATDPIDIRGIIQRAIRIVRSTPILWMCGALIAGPRLLLEESISRNDAVRNILETASVEHIQNAGASLFFFFVLGCIGLFLGSFGILAIIRIVHKKEQSSATSRTTFVIRHLFRRVWRAFSLEMLVIVVSIGIGLILSIPSGVALARELPDLARFLSFSALGLFFSIAVLLFLMRQLTLLYIALSPTPLRAALENVGILLRSRFRETVLVALAIFLVEVGVILGAALAERMLSAFLLPSFMQSVIFLPVSLVAFSLFEAWKWSVWTLFFRTIALPPQSEPVLQNQETVLQQERAVSLDKA